MSVTVRKVYTQSRWKYESNLFLLDWFAFQDLIFVVSFSESSPIQVYFQPRIQNKN